MLNPNKCGRCENCLKVSRVAQRMQAISRPAGPGHDDGTVQVWNDTLRDYPCTGRYLKEYRCTRPDLYKGNCPGATDPSARQGHYIFAYSEEGARKVMQRDYPGETIDVQLWRAAPAGAVADTEE